MKKILLLILVTLSNRLVMASAFTVMLAPNVHILYTELASLKSALQDEEFCITYCSQWQPDTYPHNVDTLYDHRNNKTWGDYISAALATNRKLALKVASLVQKKRHGKEKVFMALLNLLQCDSSTDDIVHWIKDHQEVRVTVQQFDIIRRYNERNSLLQRLENNIDNPRLLLKLGLIEHMLGNNQSAYRYLKKRTSLSTFPQENYYALLHLARVTELLSISNPERYRWEEASDYYTEAHALRPHRAEPLIRLAVNALRNKHYDEGYSLACKATELPLPSIEQEILPIEQDDYDYYRWELLSRAAWYVGEFKKGEIALRKAIAARPHYSHLYKNLERFNRKRAIRTQKETKS